MAHIAPLRNTMSQRIASHPKMRVDSDTGSLNFFSGYSFQVHHGNQRLQEILDTHTDPWGIKVALVELKGVDLPESMQRAMARQAEAEREKRAKVIHAQGEFEASQRLSEAAAVISSQPVALQLRYLQTLTEIGMEKNTSIVFPLPIEILDYFSKARGKE